MRQWSVLTAVAVLAVLAAGWFLLVSPKRSSAAALRADATAQALANDTLRAQLAALTLQARNLPRERARLAVLGQKIPNSPALPTLIRRLQDAADQAGVTILGSISPGLPAVVATGPTGAVPAPTAGAATGGGSLLAIPVTLQVTGGFFQLEQFLANLEDLPRSFLVGQLAVTPNGTASAATTSTSGVSSGPVAGSLSASITGRVFLAAQRPVVTAPVAPPVAAG